MKSAAGSEKIRVRMCCRFGHHIPTHEFWIGQHWLGPWSAGAASVRVSGMAPATGTGFTPDGCLVMFLKGASGENPVWPREQIGQFAVV